MRILVLEGLGVLRRYVLPRLVVERRYYQEWAGWDEGRPSVGDEWRCCTTDTTMAGRECKHRRQTRWHWYLDGGRCKLGELHEEHRHEDTVCPLALE